MAEFVDEFDTGLGDDDGSTIGMTFDDLDQASPETITGFNGLELDPSVTDNLDIERQEWGSGSSLGDPSIEQQMALSGVSDPPPSASADMVSESGSGHAAPQPGASKTSGSATGFFSAFSKFGAGLSALWTNSGNSTTTRVQHPTPGTIKPSNGVALALAAILVLLVIVMIFGQREA